MTMTVDALSPPTPPATVMATPPSATVSGQINAATRKQHTELNRLLIHRLPLSLPPHARTPLLYSKGLVPFARIFIFFEVEWALLARHVEKPDNSEHEFAVKKWLVSLRPTGLPRTARIKDDLNHLRAVAGPSMFATPGLGEEWTEGMRSLMRQKPHVLVAFAWVFYMAVFSGGRWIRQQLANSGSDFWTQQSGIAPPVKDDSTALLELPGFSFLSFPGDQDGEDIKAAFKCKLAEAETLLTPEEKQDIVDVSQQLFDRSLLLVDELDRMVLRESIRNWVWTILRWVSFLILLLVSLRYFGRFSGFFEREDFPHQQHFPIFD